MEKHILIRNLPSCNINKDSLLLIEECLLEKVGKMYPHATKDCFTFTIKDRFGQTEYGTVKNFKLLYFTDDVKEINISFFQDAPPIFNISVIFRTSEWPSEIKIKLENDSAHEQADVIYNNIINILKPHKNINFIFHLHEANEFLSLVSFLWVFFSIFSLLFGIGILFYDQDISSTTIDLRLIGIILIFLGLSTPFYIISNKLKPYSVFHTRKNINFSRWYNWFWEGILATLIFGWLFSKLLTFLKQ